MVRTGLSSPHNGVPWISAEHISSEMSVFPWLVAPAITKPPRIGNSPGIMSGGPSGTGLLIGIAMLSRDGMGPLSCKWSKVTALRLVGALSLPRHWVGLLRFPFSLVVVVYENFRPHLLMWDVTLIHPCNVPDLHTCSGVEHSCMTPPAVDMPTDHMLRGVEHGRQLIKECC